MGKNGWIVVAVVAVAAFVMMQQGAFKGLMDPGSRDENPTSGKAPSGSTGQQGLVQDLVGGITAAITLGGQWLQSNVKTT